MKVFKNRAFAKWASREGISDLRLYKAVIEMESGLIDANLGAYIYKKRIAAAGRGKRGGVRTLLVYLQADRAFFVYGFAKNVQDNIESDDLKALKLYAASLLAFSDDELQKLVKDEVLIEVKTHA